MFTKLIISKTILVAALIAAAPASAGESTYVGNQRFMPLPPPSRVQARTQVVMPPAKFMPLDQSRLPPVRLAAKPTIDSSYTKEMPARPANIKPSDLKHMPVDRAQQLLSIFNQSK